MARDPGSLWSPLPESGHQGTGTKTQFIVHSTADRGTAESVFNYFARPDVVVESTFIIGLSPADPTRQILDSSEVADANLTANVRAISVEVVGTENDDYTEWQVAEIIRIARWAMANHPIEARICPGPNDSGFGWHVMFGAPGPWTPVAKSCPGALRIQRLRERVFPAIFDPSLEDELTPDQITSLNECRRMLGVILGWNAPATDNERQALTRLYTQATPPPATFDPAALAAAIPADLAQQVVTLLSERLAN